MAPATAPSATLTTADDSTSLTSTQEDICRICHCGSSTGQPLLSPCRCMGSVRYSHGDCLVKWISYSNSSECELCHSEYNIRRIGMKPFSEWRRVRVQCINVLHMMLMILCVLILVGSVLWWTYVMHSENDYTQFYKSSTMRVLVYATYGPLDIMCVLLIAIEFKFTVLPLVSAWINLNQRIEVISLSKTAADTASMSDWRSINPETVDDFPGVLPGRRVPYELLRNVPAGKQTAVAVPNNEDVQRSRHIDAVAASAFRAADDGSSDVGNTAAERGSVRLDATSTITSPSTAAQPRTPIGQRLPANSQCHEHAAASSVSPVLSPIVQALPSEQEPQHGPRVVELGSCIDGMPLWQCSDA